MSAKFSSRMDSIEILYNKHEGDIHYIMNQYDMSGDDFDYLMDLKEYNNG